jgi:hypothetical protein
MKATILRQGLSKPADLSWLPVSIDSEFVFVENVLSTTFVGFYGRYFGNTESTIR